MGILASKFEAVGNHGVIFSILGDLLWLTSVMRAAHKALASFATRPF